MNFMKAWLFILCGGLLFVSISCTTPPKSDSSGGGVGSPTGDPLSTAGFLSTAYAPLAKWLDQRFDVDYKHMTPQLIFDQVPLNDIYYETSNLPTKAPAFNYSSNDISRRELLKRISNHWNLRMSFAADASGKPTAVKVEG